MRCRGLAFLVAVVLAWPLAAAEEKPGPKDKPETKEKTEPKEKLVAAGKVLAKITKLPENGTIGLSALAGKDWKPAVDVRMTDDVKVRTLRPMLFDEKGRPRKPTAKERDELKGPDKKLPGYTADMADLKMGQICEIHLVKKAGRPKSKDELPDYEPRVSIIVIAAEAQN
jgi:hypothetical protein